VNGVATAAKSLGILRLDTRFPRNLGDAGYAGSWPMPVRIHVVAGASPKRVVLKNDPALLQPFIDAARKLVDEGAMAITTSCGFLISLQAQLQAALSVPVWTSSLLMLRELQRPGVLTVDADALNSTHLLAAGADPSIPIVGLTPGCGLQRTLLEDRPTLDPIVARADAVNAAMRLVQLHPQIDSIVLECTNLPPYAQAIAVATKRPVYHLVSMVSARWAALGSAEKR
jgi:hypothetical protein